MMRHWAFDLGTTNSAIAVWNDERAEPQLVELGEISRATILTETPIIPSCVFINHARDWRTRLGQWPWVERYRLLGSLGWVGAVAQEMNATGPSPSYVESFKPLLAREGTRIMTRCGGRAYSAREVTRIFLREVLRSAAERSGRPVRSLTVAVPVDAFETYRAELQSIVTRLGARRLQFVDEPVAAALGYGLNTEREMTLLVFDFGGGTCNVALVRTTGPGKAGTPAEVIAKQGIELGGNNVDVWLAEHFAAEVGFDLDLWRGTEWYQALLDESQRVKEQLYAQESATLMLSERMALELGLRDRKRPELTRDGLIDLLTRSGLYSDIERLLEQTLAEMEAKGYRPEDIDEVLVVGGSTLLPKVHDLLERSFGRPRLRDWLPFEAVAYGACVFASGHRVQDFIRHEYALLTFDRDTNAQQYPVIVPRGTRYPTDGYIWQDDFCPTCPRGQPATEFELRIYEIGRAAGAQRSIGYDESGRLRVLTEGRNDEPLVVCLNDADPTLGRIIPPYAPHRRDARLRIAFGVNADRYLIAKVTDLDTGAVLMNDQPVVRLR